MLSKLNIYAYIKAVHRTRDLPEDVTRLMSLKRRARELIQDAAHLADGLSVDVDITADASTLGDDERAVLEDIHHKRIEAKELLEVRMAKLTDAEQASGAGPDEPKCLFPRALRRSLVALGIAEDDANKLIDVTDPGAKGRRGGRRGLPGRWHLRAEGHGRIPKRKGAPGDRRAEGHGGKFVKGAPGDESLWGWGHGRKRIKGAPGDESPWHHGRKLIKGAPGGPQTKS